MSVHKWVVNAAKKAIEDGSAVPDRVLVTTDPNGLDRLRDALKPVFEAHGGRIAASARGTNALVLVGLSDEGLSAVAELGPVRTLKPIMFG